MMNAFPCCSRGCIYTGIVYLAFLCVIPGIIGASLHHPSSDPMRLDGGRLFYINNPIGGHEMSNWEEKGKPYKLEEYLNTKSFKEWLEPIGQFESPSGSSDSDWEAGTGQTLDAKSEYNSVNFALESPMRSRRTGSNGRSSLSIVNPLDVLRKSLLMEISRRKLELDEKQRKVNAEILKNKGKK